MWTGVCSPLGIVSSKVRAFDRQDCTDLLKTDLHFTSGDHARDPFCQNAFRFGLDRFPYAEFGKDLRREVGTANTGRIADGLCCQKSFDERLSRADIRLRRAAANRHADDRAHEIHKTVGSNVTGLRQLIERGPVENENVRRFTTLQANRDGFWPAAHGGNRTR